ncbi:hypothetical protein ABIC32_001036 [Brevundimonas sp. 1080]
MVSFEDLATGSDIHICTPLSGAILIQPRPGFEQEFDALVTHLYDVVDRNYAILPKTGSAGLYASAEVMLVN